MLPERLLEKSLPAPGSIVSPEAPAYLGGHRAERDVSPSYLNLMQRNQRPITVQVLTRLTDAYGPNRASKRSVWVTTTSAFPALGEPLPLALAHGTPDVEGLALPKFVERGISFSTSASSGGYP